MNKLFALFAALLFPVMIAHAQIQTDSDGHVLVARWKAYQKLVDSDKPTDQLALLEEIKEEALSRKLAWDYFDACRTFCMVRSSINWKDLEEAQRVFAKEIDENGAPVARFHYHITRDVAKASETASAFRSELSAGSNPQFWDHDGRFPAYVRELITNDHEYAQWSLFYSNGAPDALRELFGEQYPQAAILEFALALRSGNSLPEMRRLAEKYKGKAVGYLAAYQVLDSDFLQLRKDNAGEAGYKKLLADCEAHEKGRKSLSGQEARIAKGASAQSIIDGLKAKDVELKVKDGLLTAQLRNLPSVKIDLAKGKETLWSTVLENKARSFYVQDTLSCTLPVIDDGEYEIHCTQSGKNMADAIYEKYNLATSFRNDTRHMAVYVADRMSGEPLRNFTIIVLDNSGKELGRKDVKAQDGFTNLPDELEKLFENRKARSLQIAAQKGGVKLLSRGISAFKGSYEAPDKDDDRQNCAIFTDRTAFNPGETLNYKVILYRGRYSWTVNPAGAAVKAILKDPSGNKLASEDLSIGEFGSAAGIFVIPSAQKGGMYRLEIVKDGRTLDSKSVRVDEFVLPTFVLNWEDESDRLFFVGDTLRFRGSIKAYSGHALSSAKISYELVGGYSYETQYGTLAPSADGSFELEVPATQRGSYNLTVKVTDATGETLEFSDSRTVRDGLTINWVRIDNQVRGDISLTDPSAHCAGAVMTDKVNLRLSLIYNGVDTFKGTTVDYRLLDGGKELLAGKVEDTGAFSIDLAGVPSGLYAIELKASTHDQSGKKLVSREYVTNFVKVSASDTVLPKGVRSFFLDGGDCEVMVGIAKGPVWLVMEMFGKGTDLLAHKVVKLEGDGSIRKVSFTHDKAWPDYLSLRLLYFKEGTCFTYSREMRRQNAFEALPLSFTRFTDTTAPGGRCSLAIGTEPGVECALAVFDKSSEVIMSNKWYGMMPDQIYYGSVYYRNDAGADDAWADRPVLYKTATANGMVLKSASRAVTMDAALGDDEVIVEEEALAFRLESPSASHTPEVSVRTDFASTIAWAPFLRSDKNGRIEYSFTAADKLSTFVVQLFAHDRQMHNAALRREMLVTLPVKVAVVQPQFLITGDRYGAGVTLSNSLASDVSGTLSCRFIDGDDYRTGRVISEVSKPISVPAGSSATADFAAVAPRDVQKLGMLMTFRADNPDYGSDAVFVTIPIHPDVQTITEAHSAVLRAGEDRDALIAKLRSQFVNVSGEDALLSEVDILQMLRDAIPSEVEPRADDALSLVNAIYSNVMAEHLGARSIGDEAIAKLVGKTMACHNSDGGFGWMEGMSSSPVVTAVLMERFKRAVALGWAEPEELEDALWDAAAYLDESRFGAGVGRPVWCGGISLEQYLYVRSLYSEVPFQPSDAGAKALKEFRKAVREYLVPARRRGLNGQILPKLRRVLTLKALLDSDHGSALAKAWGLRLMTGKRMSRSLDADVQSELQYIVPHWAGGCYYPNAVMPFRGLLESELYAHVMLCSMLDATGHQSEADGIRLWMMIQKETQQWNSDPAYVEAIGCVMAGSDELKSTKVIALKAAATLPLADVKASGNDMSVERHWYLMRNGEPVAVEDGQVLHVGDELRAEYRIWNRENRSFVLLTAPRPAMLRPADQLSGYYGWWLRPLVVSSWMSFSPQGYRSVFADRTEYRFDSYPEEKTTVTERFFVTQQGVFHTPAVTIESLYAPHYRANDAGSGPMMVEP